ncbi:hypothetical protein [Algoriphagus sp. NG3]|nr:hypothetical protein [Algoriphagus sp. NG3]WPR76191.1 hypothetical protein SLW71_02375 [Algoriphagus sp. NG3]
MKSSRLQATHVGKIIRNATCLPQAGISRSTASDGTGYLTFEKKIINR